MKGFLISMVVSAGLTLLSADTRILEDVHDLMANLAGIIRQLLA